MNEDIPHKVQLLAREIVCRASGINALQLEKFPILPELNGRYRFSFKSWAVKIEGTIVYGYENWGSANYTVKRRGKQPDHCFIPKFY